MTLYSDIKINWTDIIQWDDNNIRGFFGSGPGEYRWLSNFYPCDVWFEGVKYTSSEAAYMAAKTDDTSIREQISKLSAFEAKKFGHKIKLREDWNETKYNVMLRIILEKFLANKELGIKLLSTGDKYLEETNFWKDTFWGVDYKLGGENNLGKILMKVRDVLK